MKKQVKILVMDDEESFCEVMGEILQNLGFNSCCVKDGKQMVKEYTKAFKMKEPYDIVIVDLIVKQGVGGVEGIKELLALDPKAKIIISSGYSNLPIIMNYRDYGILDILPKPYNVKTLQQSIPKWLKV